MPHTRAAIPHRGQSATNTADDDWPMATSSQVERLALTPTEAARCVGVGRSYFYAQILPDLRVIRRGRKTLIPVGELERWISRNLVRTS